MPEDRREVRLAVVKLEPHKQLKARRALFIWNVRELSLTSNRSCPDRGGKLVDASRSLRRQQSTHMRAFAWSKVAALCLPREVTGDRGGDCRQDCSLPGGKPWKRANTPSRHPLGRAGLVGGHARQQCQTREKRQWRGRTSAAETV